VQQQVKLEQNRFADSSRSKIEFETEFKENARNIDKQEVKPFRFARIFIFDVLFERRSALIRCFSLKSELGFELSAENDIRKRKQFLKRRSFETPARWCTTGHRAGN
jgi:hypothetical protein